MDQFTKLHAPRIQWTNANGKILVCSQIKRTSNHGTVNELGIWMPNINDWIHYTNFLCNMHRWESQRATDRWKKKKSHILKTMENYDCSVKNHAIYTREILWYFSSPLLSRKLVRLFCSVKWKQAGEIGSLVWSCLLVLPLVSAFISKVRIHWKFTLPLDLHSLKA